MIADIAAISSNAGMVGVRFLESTAMPSGNFTPVNQETNRDAQSDLQRPQAMEHRGYTGVSFVDEESESPLHGHVIGLRDVITFQGDSVAGADSIVLCDFAQRSTWNSCKSLGRSPEKPCSGRFLLRNPASPSRLSNGSSRSREMEYHRLRLAIESVLSLETASKRFDQQRAPHKKRPRVNTRQGYQLPGLPSLSGKDTRTAKPGVPRRSPRHQKVVPETMRRWKREE